MIKLEVQVDQVNLILLSLQSYGAGVQQLVAEIHRQGAAQVAPPSDEPVKAGGTD